MKRTIIFAAALAAVSVPALSAQAIGNESYTVQSGDTLWGLSDGQWEYLYSQNPYLQTQGRRFVRDGQTIVTLYPGERLNGISSLESIPTAALVVTADSATESVSSRDQSIFQSFWFWLLAAIALLLAAALIVWRILTRDPVTSRPPVVAGGVTPERARRRFENQADQQGFDILEQQRGLISGTMMVRYGDGREMPRHLNDQVAYRALVRHWDTRAEEHIYMLQACGNDLRFGGIAQYLPGPNFRFVPDAVEQPEVAPVREPAVEPAPTPSADAEGLGAPQLDSEAGKVVIELKKAGGDRPAMLRLKGVDIEEFTFTMGHNETVIRFTQAD